MIRRLQELSVSGKLSAVILSGIGAALAVSFVLLLVADRSFVRASLVRELSAVVDVLGENCAAAVAFQDQGAATENLAALAAVPDIEAALIVQPDGSIFASYRAGPEAIPPAELPFPDLPEMRSHLFDDDGLWLTHEIRLGERSLGHLVVLSDLARLQDRLVQYSHAMAVILMLALMAGLAIARRLQPWITRPIEHLVETAQRISSEQDYSLRATCESSDEIGHLVTNFNQMVDRVENRDRELRDHQERLEELLEERLAELHGKEEQLRQAQKMEAVGRLAGGVAHDFNNLLTVINGSAELVLDDPALAPDLQEHVLEILKGGERAAALTRQLLAFSRKQVLEERPVDLNRVLREMHSMLARLIGEHIVVRLDLDPELERIKADPGQIQQVILNLAVNSRDAMPDGGVLTLRTRSCRIPAGGSAEHPEVAPGAYGLLEVRDTGTGIDPEIQAQVFEPFFTTKKEGEGTGLGLSTVYGVLKQSGGHIGLRSKPGKGTVFTLHLREAEESGAERKEETAPPAETAGRGTILLVEDQKAVRELVRKILERHGYQVLTAGSADRARRLFRQHRATLDLLLTDVVLPETNGRELAADLRAQRPDLAVLFMSGYPQSDQGSAPGAAEVPGRLLTKPFSPQDLLAAVGEETRKARLEKRRQRPATASED